MHGAEGRHSHTRPCASGLSSCKSTQYVAGPVEHAAASTCVITTVWTRRPPASLDRAVSKICRFTPTLDMCPVILYTS